MIGIQDETKIVKGAELAEIDIVSGYFSIIN